MGPGDVSPSAARGGSPFGWLGGCLGFLGVAAGAFGAHALRSSVAAPMLQVYETAARYQLVHAVALVVTALALERGRSRPLVAAGWLFAAGIALFSGSLYLLALTSVPAWGAVTPFGGQCLLAAWVSLAVGLARRS